MVTGSGTGTPVTSGTYVTLAEMKEYLGNRNSTTFSVNASTDVLTVVSTEITWNTGQPVVLSSTNTLPAGLSADTVYFVIAVSGQTLKLATTRANAVAGTAVDITDTGTGVHTITKAITDDDLIEDCIDDAVEYIESRTGKSFVATTDTRYYRQEAVNYLTLTLDEDLLTVTTLTKGDEDGTEIDSDDYWLLPRNEGPPYRRIELKENSDHSWDWTTDGEISVAGTWGFSSNPPDDILRAVKVLAAYFYRQKDTQVFDVVAVPEAGVITIPQGIPATVNKIIAKYQHPME